MRRFFKTVKFVLFCSALAAVILAARQLPAMASDTDDFEFKWILPPEFYKGSVGFAEGRTWVQREEGGPWILYDDKGNVIKDNLECEFVTSYASDIALFRTKDRPRKYGLVDASGDITVPGVLFQIIIVAYGDGLIPARQGDVGYIDKSGEWVILPQFQQAHEFKDGLAKAKTDDKWGMINKKGEWVIPPEFGTIYSFIGNITSAEKNGKWGIIDKSGSTVLDFTFDKLANFVKEDGVTIAGIGDLYGLIDISGNFVVEPQSITPTTNLSMLSESTKLIGFIDKHGKVGYFDLKGNLAIDFKFIFDEEIRKQNSFYDFHGGLAAVVLDDPERTRAIIDEEGVVVFRFPPDAFLLTRPLYGNYMVYFDKDHFMVCDKEGRVFDITAYLSPHFDGMDKSFFAGTGKIFSVQTPKPGKFGYFTITPKEGD
jgi:hypothetical protein